MSENFLFLHSRCLSAEDVPEILNILRAHPKTVGLVLNNNSLGDEGVRLLIEGLLSSPKLSALHLSGNSLTDQSCVHLERLYSIEHLDLSDNPVAGKSLEKLSVRSIDLTATRITQTDLQHLKEKGVSVECLRGKETVGLNYGIKGVFVPQPVILDEGFQEGVFCRR